MIPMMKLVLVRHGESEWNKLNLFTGWMDVDLSEKGHEEAKQAGVLLKKEGYTVHLGGNIGKPLLCELPFMKPEDIAVTELSSFQLHSMLCSPDVALITNITPNHLDKHKNYADYIEAKKSQKAIKMQIARYISCLSAAKVQQKNDIHKQKQKNRPKWTIFR